MFINLNKVINQFFIRWMRLWIVRPIEIKFRIIIRRLFWVLEVRLL